MSQNTPFQRAAGVHAAAIVTLGSDRQANSLIKSMKRAGVEADSYHISDRASNGDSKTSQSILAELQGIPAANMTRITGISLGRATVPGGITAIASGWMLYANSHSDELESEWIGAAPAEALIFEDKLSSLDILTHAAVPTVPYSGQSCRDLGWPVVVKARRLTGGAGMRLATNSQEASSSAEWLRAMGQDVVFTSLRRGIEVSVEALLVRGHVIPLANVFKERCDERLIHADSKIKIALPVASFPPCERLLTQFTAAFPNVLGYLSIEAIIIDDRSIEIIEVATRRTGNYPLSNWVAGPGGSEARISNALKGGSADGPLPRGSDRCAIGFAFSLDQPKLSIAELQRNPHFLELSIDDLSHLTASERTGRRVRLAYSSVSHGWEEAVFATKLTRDDSLINRYETLMDTLITIGADPSARNAH